jgi:hypothetical protein
MMSESIGKHLIEITNWGTPWYKGVIQSETDGSYVAMIPGTTVGRRVFKKTQFILLPENADIDRALRWYQERWKEFSGPVSGAEATLTEAKRQRAEAALEALKAGA